MQQVVIALRKRDSRAVIEALQDAGVLHLVPVQQDVLHSDGATDAEYRREAERLLARTETTIAELGAARTQAGVLPPEDRWATGLDDVAGPASSLNKQRQALEADLDVQRTYGPAVSALADMVGTLDRSRRVALVPFVYHKPEELTSLQAALRETLEGRYDLATQVLGTAGSVQGANVGAVAVLTIDRDAARAAVSKAHLGELRLPGRFEGMPLGEVKTEFAKLDASGAQQLQGLEQQRQALAAQHGPTLFALRDALSDQVALHDVQNISARGKYSMVMQGYIPEDRASALKATLERFGDAVSYEVHPVDPHHDAAAIPVELKNNNYSRNFEPVLSLLPLPRYGNFDPTGIISVFFPLFFGFIIADMGYGALFFAIGTWFANKARRGEGLPISFMDAYLSPDMMGRLGVIIRMMSSWAILWGLLTGELFGNLGEHLGLFYHHAGFLQRVWGIHLAEHGAHAQGLIPIFFPRLLPEFTNTALISTLIVGIFMVIWGWVIRVQLASKHGHKDHMWEAIGMIGGLVGLVSLAFLSQGGNQLMNGSIYSNFANPLTLLMWLGFVVFGAGLALSKVPLMIIEILSQGGNIISFARLFAVGVAGAILANLATDLGWSMYDKMGPLGIIIGVVLALLVHAFALAITIVGHVLQPIRLHFVEFLTPTGYHNESGTPYTPLRRLSTPVALKK